MAKEPTWKTRGRKQYALMPLDRLIDAVAAASKQLGEAPFISSLSWDEQHQIEFAAAETIAELKRRLCAENA